MDQQTHDPSQPTPPSSQPPGPSGQEAIPAPQGPVTRLSKVAGITTLLFGLAVTAYGGYGVVWSATSDSNLKGISILIASVVVVMGLPALVVAIGILRGKNWGRIIGIVYFVPCSLVFGTLAVFGAQSIPVPGLFFVLSAYSAIALIARWREPATA